MGLRALLDRAWSGIASLVRAPTAAELFRTAERLRQEGRYHAAAELVTEGLRHSPGSPAGHILDAYLHLVSRQVEPARDAFKRALSLDAEHPRALLGLARISLEEGDAETACRYLARALEYHPDFPEIRELQERLSSSPTRPANTAPRPAPRRERLPLPPGGRDMVLAQLAGGVLLARCERGRQPALARQATELVRLAAPMLVRAGLGPLRRGLIEASADAVFLQADPDVVLSLALPSSVGAGTGLASVGRLWTATVGDRRP